MCGCLAFAKGHKHSRTPRIWAHPRPPPKMCECPNIFNNTIDVQYINYCKLIYPCGAYTPRLKIPLAACFVQDGNPTLLFLSPLSPLLSSTFHQTRDVVPTLFSVFILATLSISLDRYG